MVMSLRLRTFSMDALSDENVESAKASEFLVAGSAASETIALSEGRSTRAWKWEDWLGREKFLIWSRKSSVHARQNGAQTDAPLQTGEGGHKRIWKDVDTNSGS